MYLQTQNIKVFVKFKYFEKATKFCEISTLLLSYVVPIKSKVEILKKFVTFSEYMNFIIICPWNVKVHIFWEGHKILWNLHLTFDWHYIGQK